MQTLGFQTNKVVFNFKLACKDLNNLHDNSSYYHLIYEENKRVHDDRSPAGQD